MKLGILGTGKIVQEFLPWLVEHTPFTVQAVCSTPRSAAKAAELCAQYQIPQHTTNYFELLQWVDAVYIAVPNLQHARYARVALEAGKHVIVEKPMAVTAAETEELAALAQRKRLFLFGGDDHPVPAQLRQTPGAAAPGGHSAHGTVQLQPVFQPVRRLLRRADPAGVRPAVRGRCTDGFGRVQRQLHRGSVR